MFGPDAQETHAFAGGSRGTEQTPNIAARLGNPYDEWSPLWRGVARVSGGLPSVSDAQSPPWQALRGLGQFPPPEPGVIGPASRRIAHQGPRFDVQVDANGYAWWYIDAFSEDGQYGLTIIAFVGSVFSPYYKFSGRGDPENHCAINVAFTGPRSGAWAMTERPKQRVDRSATHFAVGPSALHWDGAALTIDIDEVSAPLPARVRGRVRVFPMMIGNTAFALDPAGLHRWHPISPRARVEVDMDSPNVRWNGDGYFDSNFGNEPLEAGFEDWHWSRAHLSRDVAVLYEGTRRNGDPFNLALRMDQQGNWEDVAPPPMAQLARTGWMIDRKTRADAGHSPKVLRTWVDAPFYARSALATTMYGESVRAVHESLSLNRFRSPIVQMMLPYRMPRAFW